MPDADALLPVRLLTYSEFPAGMKFIGQVEKKVSKAFNGQPPVEPELVPCQDEQELAEQLTLPALLTLVSAHGFRPRPDMPHGGLGATEWTDYGPLLHWHHFAARPDRPTINTTGLILDACYTGQADYQHAISTVLAYDSGYVGFDEVVRVRQSKAVIPELVIALLRLVQAQCSLSPRDVTAAAHRFTGDNPRDRNWTPVRTAILHPVNCQEHGTDSQEIKTKEYKESSPFLDR